MHYRDILSNISPILRNNIIIGCSLLVRDGDQEERRVSLLAFSAFVYKRIVSGSSVAVSGSISLHKPCVGIVVSCRIDERVIRQFIVSVQVSMRRNRKVLVECYMT